MALNYAKNLTPGLAGKGQNRGEQRESSGPRRSRWIFGLVAGLLALGLGAVAPGPLPGWFGIMVLNLAMGIMNTTVTRVGDQSVSLGYVTRNLEQPCPAFGACGERRASIPCREPARYASAARRLAGRDLDCLRHRRLACRGSDAKSCRLKPVVAHRHPIGPCRARAAFQSMIAQGAGFPDNNVRKR